MTWFRVWGLRKIEDKENESETLRLRRHSLVCERRRVFSTATRTANAADSVGDEPLPPFQRSPAIAGRISGYVRPLQCCRSSTFAKCLFPPPSFFPVNTRGCFLSSRWNNSFFPQSMSSNVSFATSFIWSGISESTHISCVI